MQEYTFELTFWMSVATWAAENFAQWIVRGVMILGWGLDVEREAGRDLVRFPGLTGVMVVGAGVVLMNMLVGIVRVRF